MEDKILIINTGGTIGMVGHPLRPAYNWQEITKEHPILNKFPTDFYQLEKLIDSSDVTPKFWIELADIIEKNYDRYIGFVILHGTDTMAYTGSILSYMLKNLAKPVILTGSQTPISNDRSDALQNLVNSIYIAGNKLFNLDLVPEVCICFRDNLLRANRSKKTDSNNYFGFSSPNYNSLADIGTEIKIIKDRILEIPKEKFYADKNINENIMMIELFPGLNPKYIKNLMDSNPDIEGLIIKAFGSGNTSTNDDFLNILETITKKNIPVLDITQCVSGSVKMPLYESTDILSKIGIINGGDLTSEAALTKMMYLLGKKLNTNEIKNYFSVSIAGEQTV